MPLPLLWIIGGAIAAAIGTAAACSGDDNASTSDREAEERAEAERRRRQRERAQARSRFLAMRNDEILAFAKAHGLSVDGERLRNAPADSQLPKQLVFKAIEQKDAQAAASRPDEARQLAELENDRAAIAQLLASTPQAEESRHD